MQNANTLKCITSFYFTKSASWYLLHFKDWLRRWTLAQQQKIIFVRLILLTCPKTVASNKEPRFRVIKKRTRTNKLIALPTHPHLHIRYIYNNLKFRKKFALKLNNLCFPFKWMVYATLIHPQFLFFTVLSFYLLSTKSTLSFLHFLITFP